MPPAPGHRTSRTQVFFAECRRLLDAERLVPGVCSRAGGSWTPTVSYPVCCFECRWLLDAESLVSVWFFSSAGGSWTPKVSYPVLFSADDSWMPNVSYPGVFFGGPAAPGHRKSRTLVFFSSADGSWTPKVSCPVLFLECRRLLDAESLVPWCFYRVPTAPGRRASRTLV